MQLEFDVEICNMKIIELESAGWHSCRLIDDKSAVEPQRSAGKLHLALSVEEYLAHNQQVYQRLKWAVENAVFPAFKMLDKQKVFAAVGSNKRLGANPFTIYLHEKPNISAIFGIIKELEVLLPFISSLNNHYLSAADLKITSRFSYREEQLQGEYVVIAGAPEEQLNELRALAEGSSVYQQLVRLASTASYMKIKQVQRVCEQQYDYCRRIFRDQQAFFGERLRAACLLLEISPDSLGGSDSKKIIDRSYRLVSRKYHPDAFARLQVPRPFIRKVSEVFVLLKEARSILGELVAQKQDMEHLSTLQQSPYVPTTQYDPCSQMTHSGFSSMARSEERYMIHKNWEDTKFGGEEDTRPTLYQAGLQALRSQNPKEVILPGYQAFYYLFTAGWKPTDRLFGGGDVWRIIQDAKKEGRVWLLQRVVTNRQFIGLLGYQIITMAYDLTASGYISLALTLNDAFEYYYLNHYSLVGMSSSLLENPDFDCSRAASFLVENPQYIPEQINVISSWYEYKKLLEFEIFQSFVEREGLMVEVDRALRNYQPEVRVMDFKTDPSYREIEAEYDELIEKLLKSGPEKDIKHRLLVVFKKEEQWLKENLSPKSTEKSPIAKKRKKLEEFLCYKLLFCIGVDRQHIISVRRCLTRNLLIGVGDARGIEFQEKVEVEKFPIFSKQNDEPLMVSLNLLWMVYNCIGIPDKFYGELEYYASPQNKINPPSVNAFHPRYIEEFLFKFASEELAVYADGVRHTRKHARCSEGFTDFEADHEIRAIGEIKSLYDALGKSDVFIGHASQACLKMRQRFLDACTIGKKRCIEDYSAFRAFTNVSDLLLEGVSALRELQFLLRNVSHGEGADYSLDIIRYFAPSATAEELSRDLSARVDSVLTRFIGYCRRGLLPEAFIFGVVNSPVLRSQCGVGQSIQSLSNLVAVKVLMDSLRQKQRTIRVPCVSRVTEPGAAICVLRSGMARLTAAEYRSDRRLFNGLKKVLSSAVETYIRWYKGEKGLTGSRAGEDVIYRSQLIRSKAEYSSVLEFDKRMSCLSHNRELAKMVNEYLGASVCSYDRYSFSTFLLDQLAGADVDLRSVLPWIASLSGTVVRGKYSSSKVKSLLPVARQTGALVRV